MRIKLLIPFLFICLITNAQGNWKQKAPLPAVGRSCAVAFSIGNKGYLGTGRINTSTHLDDFWEYDPLGDTWTQKANFAGGLRNGAIGFSIGNRGYIGGGQDDKFVFRNDFWKYDPGNNIWQQVADFAGVPRIAPSGFSIGNNGYIGTGYDGSAYLKDFWKYDALNNSWIQLGNFIGGLRTEIDRAPFVIGNIAYWGTGNFENDFWQYNPVADTWTQIANLPAPGRIGATGFSICGQGFLGFGADSTYQYFKDVWMYQPALNAWNAVAAFPAEERYDLPSFVINNKAYLVTGQAKSGYLSELWEFTLDPAIIVSGSNSTLCLGQSATLTASGAQTYVWSPGGQTTTSIIVSPTISQTYTITGTYFCSSGSSTVAVYVSSVNASISGKTSVCTGQMATLIASGGNTYSWIPEGQNTSIINPPPGTYSVIVSLGTCSDTAAITVTALALPNLTIISQTNLLCNGGDDGSAVVTASGGNSPYIYNWNPSGGANPVANGLSAGTYIIKVTDANGCTKTEVVTITEPAPISLALPNAFSPNNDGDNDEFCLQGAIEDCIKEIEIVIYNRLGEVVYQSNNKKFCWDGTYHGKPENTAVFVYSLKATLINGNEIKKKGNISLLR